jgi:hypothetical protein
VPIRLRDPYVVPLHVPGIHVDLTGDWAAGFAHLVIHYVSIYMAITDESQLGC